MCTCSFWFGWRVLLVLLNNPSPFSSCPSLSKWWLSSSSINQWNETILWHRPLSVSMPFHCLTWLQKSAHVSFFCRFFCFGFWKTRFSFDSICLPCRSIHWVPTTNKSVSSTTCIFYILYGDHLKRCISTFQNTKPRWHWKPTKDVDERSEKIIRIVVCASTRVDLNRSSSLHHTLPAYLLSQLIYYLYPSL